MQTDSSDSISHSHLETLLSDYLKSIEVNAARGAARLLLRQLQERNFMLYPLPPDRYSFVHRSFLEYFCAWEIVWQFKETQQLDFAKLRELFMRHWPDPSWHEILRLICGLLEAQFVGQLIEVLQVQEGESVQFAHLFLAARCLGEVRNRAKLDQNLTLLTQIQALVHYQREPLYQFQPEFPSNSQPTRPEILFFDEPTLLARQVRIQAVQTVAAIWPHLPQTQSWLQVQANQHPDANLREAASEALSLLHKPLMISMN
jgi:hypothetical protein